jgi:hypothetical protein
MNDKFKVSSQATAEKLGMSKQTLLTKVEKGMVRPAPVRMGEQKNAPFYFHVNTKIIELDA